LRGIATFLLCACASGADAQISGTISGVSDYRYRGIAFSDRMPAAQGGFTYDDPLGWYAGVFGSTVRLVPPTESSSNFQAMAYAGYATRLASGVSLEAGGDYSAFNGSSSDNFGEFYIGAAGDGVGARLYYSPRYFGSQSNAVYAEINASRRLFDHVRIIGHVGWLRTRYQTAYGTGYGYTYGTSSLQNIVDGRVGLGIDLSIVQLEIAWVGNSEPDAAYRVTGTRSPDTVVVTLSRSF
jgi:uncharacterized protein (TIGR02001 family)